MSTMAPSLPARVLVTGGTSAIGRAVVESLTAAGSSVVFTGRNAERAEQLVAQTGAAFLPVDVRDVTAVRACVRSATAELGGLAGLVIATGTVYRGPLLATSDQVWDELVATNLTSAFAWATASLPELRSSAGAIVTVASAAAQWPGLASPAYAVTKRALVALTEMLAAEAAPEVRVNAVLPGDCAEPMASELPSERAARDGAVQVPPLGRFAEPADIAAAVLFLLSDQSQHCTGASLRIDGGLRGAHR